MPSISSLLPVGSILHSMLSESQFQSEAGAEWVICDGRSATGTRYNAVTGNSTIPDARGLYMRAKNNSRSDGNEDPAGEIALGTFQASRNKAHDHGFTDPGHTHSLNMFTGSGGFGGNGPPGGSNLTAGTATSNTTGITINSDGGTDGRPNSLVVNVFIKIN